MITVSQWNELWNKQKSNLPYVDLSLVPVNFATMFKNTKDMERYINGKITNYVNNYLKKGIIFYRGVKKKTEGAKELRVKTDRIPVDTPKYIHEYTNKYLKNKFGFDRSNSLFVSRKADATVSYGSTSVIIPVGRFEFLHSRHIYDFYTGLPIILESMPSNMTSQSFETVEQYKPYKERLDRYLSRYTRKNYFDRNDDNEVILHCSKYVIIHAEIY